MTDANGSAIELIIWYFVGRIALQFVFLSLIIYLLLNVIYFVLVIILPSLGMFPSAVREAPQPPLCTCGKWKYCLRDYADCPGNWRVH